MNTSLVWFPWPANVKELPKEELLLVEIESKTGKRQYRTAIAGKGAKGAICVVGDVFHFDRVILRWASIQHLVD